MKAEILKSTVISLIILTALNATAQQPPRQQQQRQRVKQSQPVRPLEPESTVKFGFTFNTRYVLQAEEQADGTRGQYFYHEAIPAINTDAFRFRAVMAYIDKFKTPATSEFDNTTLELRKNKPWDLGDYFMLQPEAIGALPLFQRTSNFNGYAGARLNLIVNSKNMEVPDFIFKYGFQFGKLFQKKENTGTEVEPNFSIDTRLRQRVHLGYQITPWLLAMTYFHFDSNFYFDNYIQNTFYHETFLEFAPLDFMAITLGLSNGGGVYTGDTQEQDNLRFYDSSSSEVFLQAGVSF